MQRADIDSPNDPIKQLTLLVLSDLHLGEALVDKRRLKEFFDEVKSNPWAYVIVNGDVINNATRESVSDIYSEVMTPDQAIDKCVELLDPIKDRILVMRDGNHEGRTYKKDGIKLLYRAANELGIPDVYAPGAYGLYLSFGNNRAKKGTPVTYLIYGKHGTGGGSTVGGKANQLEKMAATIPADVFIHSHTHIPLGFRLKNLYPDYQNRKIVEKEMVFCNANAFLLPGGYGEELGLRPASTLYPKIYLEGDRRLARCLI